MKKNSLEKYQIAFITTTIFILLKKKIILTGGYLFFDLLVFIWLFMFLQFSIKIKQKIIIFYRFFL